MLKNFNYSLIALFFITIFSSCTKEMDEVRPLSASGSSALETTEDKDLDFKFEYTNPAFVGQEATLIATSGGYVNGVFVASIGDKKYLRIERETSPGVWEILSDNSRLLDGNAEQKTLRASLTYNWTPIAAEIGDVNFRAVVIKVETHGQTKVTTHEIHKELLAIVTVREACTSGMTLSMIGTSATTPLGDNKYETSFTYKLTACQAVSGVKVQGGLIAGVNSYKTESSLGIRALKKSTGNSTVLYWEGINLSASSSATFKVTYVYEKSLVCGYQNVLNGTWSAKAKGVADAIADKKATYWFSCPTVE